MKNQKKIYLGIAILAAALLLLVGPGRPLLGRHEPAAAGPSVSQGNEGDTGKSEGRFPDTKRDRKAIDEAAERWYQELLAKYPEFHIEYRTVPDERNGYMQWLRLLQKLGPEQGLPDFKELRESWDSGGKVDVALIEKWITAHPDLFAEIQRIAALPDRSAKGIDGQAIAVAGGVAMGDCEKLLLGHARLAAAQGNPDAAMAAYANALNLAGHADGVEGPSFLHFVVGAGLRARVVQDFYEQLLPVIAADPALLAEGRKLVAGANGRTGAPEIVIGEWNSATRNFLLPALLNDPEAKRQIKVENPQAFLDAYTAGMREMSANLKTPAYYGTAEIPQLAAVELLTGRDRETFKGMGDLLAGIMAGLQIQRADFVRYAAALAILAGEDPPLELLTGKPFLWDPVKRQLSYPADMKVKNMSFDPLTLP